MSLYLQHQEEARPIMIKIVQSIMKDTSQPASQQVSTCDRLAIRTKSKTKQMMNTSLAQQHHKNTCPPYASAAGVRSTKRRRIKLRYGAIPIPVATIIRSLLKFLDSGKRKALPVGPVSFTSSPGFASHR